MALEEAISDIQNNLRRNGYPNEQAISQGIILRILQVMGWPVYDTQVVIPEYSVENKRVDFALCVQKSSPIIFIEVKKPGNVLGADKQLFSYAFHQGIPLAIATDGKEWNFYWPAGIGDYDERKVYKLDLVERSKTESVYRFGRYLSFREVANGNALKNAQKDYENVSQERQAKKNIPVAWEKLLEEKNEMLVDVVAEKVGSICGLTPSKEQIIEYLGLLVLPSSIPARVQTPTPVPPPAPTPDFFPSPATQSPASARPIKQKKIIKVIFPDGSAVCSHRMSTTMVDTIKKIGLEKVMALNMRVYGYPFVSRERYQTEYNVSDAGSGFRVFTHSNTPTKVAQLKKINEMLNLGLRIELISPE